MFRFLKKLVIFALLVGGVFFGYKYITKLNTNPNSDKKSEHYVNSIYVSQGRIYDKILNDKEKRVYMIFLKNINEGNPFIESELLDVNCDDYDNCKLLLEKVNDALIVDHPELLYYSYYDSSFDKNTNKIKIDFYYTNHIQLLSAIDEARINFKLNKIAKEVKLLNDREKILYVYDYIAKHNVYDSLFALTSNNQSIYSAFLGSNCSYPCYAKMAQVIFQKIGIDSQIVIGKDKMWNLIKYNDKYYYFDSIMSASYQFKTNAKYYYGVVQLFMNDYERKYEKWNDKNEVGVMFSLDKVNS